MSRYIEQYIPKEGEGHNKLMVVTGVSGCGKDYLLDKGRQRGIIPPSIQTFSFGEELFNQLRQNFPQLRSRDDIKSMVASDDIKQGMVGALEHFIKSQPAIINAHILPYEQGRLVVRPDSDKVLKPLSYLFIWSEPDQIKRWRQNDPDRLRLDESVSDISLHQELAYAVTRVVAEHVGAGLVSVWNREDNLDDNLSKLQESVKNLKQKNHLQRSAF